VLFTSVTPSANFDGWKKKHVLPLQNRYCRVAKIQKGRASIRKNVRRKN
jgi:hypothetical protein